MNLISVIVPCWNEEETIPIYYEHMCPVMDAIDADCELIFVDDGSQDATLSEMKKLSEKDARCQYLSFSRNFGKEAAIYAGLCKAKGDYVVVMDVCLLYTSTVYKGDGTSFDLHMEANEIIWKEI